MRRRTRARWCWGLALGLLAWPLPAGADQSVRDVLVFLLTNRSVATGDFVRDDVAAAATSDTIAQLLVNELGTIPVTSAASGFTYRLDPALGVSVRSSDSFGPVFVERALTAGRGRAAFAVGHHTASFTELDGRSLRDGTLISTASRLDGETEPFDVETVTLRLQTRSTLVSGVVGLSDRVDVGVVVPFTRVSLDGQRIDTYRGTPFLQASGFANTSGLGDIIVRGKVALVLRGASGVAIGADVQLPTGNPDNLLGADETTVTPRLIVSHERGRFGVHGNVGYAAGGFSREWHYRGAASIAAHSRLTVVGELLGRRPSAAVRVAETTEPHPDRPDVDTIRLTGVRGPGHRLTLVAAARWNVASSWLLTATVVRPLTTDGLNAAWVPMIALDYAFGR